MNKLIILFLLLFSSCVSPLNVDFDKVDFSISTCDSSIISSVEIYRAGDNSPIYRITLRDYFEGSNEINILEKNESYFYDGTVAAFINSKNYQIVVNGNQNSPLINIYTDGKGNVISYTNTSPCINH